jgi:ATP-dependent protease ClpP protease subunit
MKVDKAKRQIFVYGPIGEAAGYISADAFAAGLDQLGPGPVEVRVNSPGGGVHEGQLMRQLLRRHDGRAKIVVDALAASAATMFLVEPSFERVVAPGAMLMIHLPWSTTSGNSNDFEQTARILKKFGEQLADDYQRVMKVNRSDLLKMLAEETWFTAKEAVAIGLADRIDGTLPKVEPITGKLVEKYRHAPAALLPAKAALPRARSATPKLDAAERRARESGGWTKVDRMARAIGIARQSEQRKKYERKLAIATEAIRYGLDPQEALRNAR